MTKLNLGCGQIRPEGWINADSSMNTMLQKLPLGKWIARSLGSVIFDTSNAVYMNLNKRWRHIPDTSVEVVYASHLFEHLEIESSKLFLAEAYRTLKPNGSIRLVMPDLYAHCKEYVASIDNGQIEVLGLFQGYPHRHKYMYDKLSLTKLFSDVGFRDIRLSEYGQSHYIKDILDVEGPHLYGGYANSIYIEALK